MSYLCLSSHFQYFLSSHYKWIYIFYLSQTTNPNDFAVKNEWFSLSKKEAFFIAQYVRSKFYLGRLSFKLTITTTTTIHGLVLLNHSEKISIWEHNNALIVWKNIISNNSFIHTYLCHRRSLVSSGWKAVARMLSFRTATITSFFGLSIDSSANSLPTSSCADLCGAATTLLSTWTLGPTYIWSQI